MPLLGRHKSGATSNTSGGSTPTGSVPQLKQAAGNKQLADQATHDRGLLLCDSPMFGIRKQIVAPMVNLASSEPTGLPAELSSIPQQITRQQIHYAFSIIDNNHDGLIDLRDLSQMLANLGVPIDEAILSHVMASASKRGK